VGPAPAIKKSMDSGIKVPAKEDQLSHGTPAEGGQTSVLQGGFAGLACAVRNRNLLEASTARRQKNSQEEGRDPAIRRNERSGFPPYRRSDQLEWNVGVGETDVKKDPEQQPNGRGENQAVPRILAILADADDTVQHRGRSPERREIFQWNLTVAVDEEQKVPLRGVKAGPKRGTVPLIALMKNPDPRIFGRELVKERAGPVFASIINNDQFSLLHNIEDIASNIVNGALDSVFFIVGWHDDAEL